MKPYKSSEIYAGDKEFVEEGEGEGEGEGEDIVGGRRPIAPELPVDVQGYRIIDSRGPEGINNAVSCPF